MESPLTTEGMIFITIGWGGVSTLFIWAMYKVLKAGNDLEGSEE